MEELVRAVIIRKVSHVLESDRAFQGTNLVIDKTKELSLVITDNEHKFTFCFLLVDSADVRVCVMKSKSGERYRRFDLPLVKPRLFSDIARRIGKILIKDQKAYTKNLVVIEALQKIATSKYDMGSHWVSGASPITSAEREANVQIKISKKSIKKRDSSITFALQAVTTKGNRVQISLVRTSVFDRPAALEDKWEFPLAEEGGKWFFPEKDKVDIITKITGLAMNLIASSKSYFLPIESSQYTPRERQLLMVSVPIRIALAAVKSNSQEWTNELLEDAMERASKLQDKRKSIVWMLFLQLIRVELASPTMKKNAIAAYRKMEEELARMRRVDPDLPFNPVIPYQLNHPEFKRDLKSLVNHSIYDTNTSTWFSGSATLEEILTMSELL